MKTIVFGKNMPIAEVGIVFLFLMYLSIYLVNSNIVYQNSSNEFTIFFSSIIFIILYDMFVLVFRINYKKENIEK
jgi:hypothetical protein